MDIATIAGLVVALGAIFLSYTMEGGHMSTVLQPPAMILVIFGTFGAATMTTSLKLLISLPKIMKNAFFEPKLEAVEIIEEVVRLAEKARREGLLSLEKEFESLKNDFLRKGIEFAIDGVEPSALRTYLEIEMTYIAERHKAGAGFFAKLGGFAPTLGIIGTVLGLVHALGTVTDASKMASSIAGAFIATLWGIALANLLFLPLGEKLKHRNEEEALLLEVILEGVSSLASGENPRMIRAKLLGFLRPMPQKKE